MRISFTIPALLGALLLAPALPAAADTEPMPSECQRFESAAKPEALQPRLARLCVRLIDAHDSDEGMNIEEREAAARLGRYLAIVGELDIRRGAIALNGIAGRARATTETARYLIAHRIGLLEMADRLAPSDRQASLR
jgi:hypothetical protein